MKNGTIEHMDEIRECINSIDLLNTDHGHTIASNMGESMYVKVHNKIYIDEKNNSGCYLNKQFQEMYLKAHQAEGEIPDYGNTISVYYNITISKEYPLLFSEAAMYCCMDKLYYVHLQSPVINGLCCAKKGKSMCKKLFPDALWLTYNSREFTRGLNALTSIDAYYEKYACTPTCTFLQNDGVIIAFDDIDELTTVMTSIVDTLKKQYEKAHCSVLSHPEMPPAEKMYSTLPYVRGVITHAGYHPLLISRKPFPVSEDMVMLQYGCHTRAFHIRDTTTYEDYSTLMQNEHFLPSVIALQDAVCTRGLTIEDAENTLSAALETAQVIEYAKAFDGIHTIEPTEQCIELELDKETDAVAFVHMYDSLSSKVAIVTGGAQGFGLGIADYLAYKGANVVLADINKEKAVEAAEKLNADYDSICAKGMYVDISNEESIENLLKEVVVTYGGVDLLVANAGILRAGSVKDFSLEDWELVTKVNYTGYFLCVKHVSKVMALQNAEGTQPDMWSDIIQINSKSGLEGSNKNAAYAGGKFGGIGLTQSFAKELVTDRIKVNAICPGNYFDGPLWSDPEKGLFAQYLAAGKVEGAETHEDVRAYYEAQVPMGRGCTPEDVARAIIYCVQQKYETGQAIPVTGGQIMR